MARLGLSMPKAFGMRRDRHSRPCLAPSTLLQDRDKSHVLEDICCKCQCERIRTGVRFHLEPCCFLPNREDHGIMESSCFRPAVVKSSILC